MHRMRVAEPVSVPVAPSRGGAVVDLFRRLVADESGTSHFEYAIIAVFTGTALIAGLIVLQGGLDNAYRSLAALVDAVSGGS